MGGPDQDDMPRRRQVLEKPRFDGWDVGQLREYIAELQAEIARAEAGIEAREGHRAAAEAFFRKG
ncbi:DUF1192 domain-containing protein [Roseomonas fluvialis]|uniref:DUF1192 domain-containing protein n=1 Tax=Roseomonas fluvialis TaxID=1750527 RepID=A0ABN6P2P1_9PROT|nr:DUF1192 domain-containing protein [Roseomonas fluvialis]BDG72869.1 hypothetical protein Rmf_27980 [Roseomonas fluvialis]